MRNRTAAALVAGSLVVGASLAGGAVYAATSNVIYYACLKGGTLSDVGTAAPKCGKNATQINWNNTGPEGPAGPQGVAGPEGAPGAAGVAGVNGVSGYETHNFTIPLTGPGAGAPPLSTVISHFWIGCPNKKVPMSGGFSIQEQVTGSAVVVGSHLGTDPAGNPGWQFEVRQTADAATAQLTMYDSCVAVS